METVKGQLRQPIDEDEFENLKRMIKKVDNIVFRRLRDQGLTNEQIDARKKAKFKEFLDSTRPVFSYHGKPYVLDKTQVWPWKWERKCCIVTCI